jgi:ATP-dependent helicase/nuclease subunit A
MPIRTAIWKVGTPPELLAEATLPNERLLEEMIIAAPRLLSEEWMLIGRQEDTGLGGRIDLLAVAPDGAIVLIELKRDRTPREVVAQAIDYAYWVSGLDPEDIVAIYRRFAPGRSLAADFEERFGQELDDDALNQSHQIVVVAAALDDSTERIIAYLTERGIAINALLFQVFANGAEQLISRAWLIDPIRAQASSAATPGDPSEPWNGEFYSSFGHGESRSWEDALARGPEEWRDLIEEARETALSAFLEKPALKEGRWTLELCEGDDEDRMEESRKAALSALDELEAGENHKSAFELLESIDLRGGRKRAWSDGELASVKEALKIVRELARAELRRGIVVLESGPADERLAGALPILRDAFRQARLFLSEAKRRSRVMDFADLEVHALRALEHQGVRDYYCERWRAFLVDEFQDTNPVQAELLTQLTEGTKLTVVGDEKQSIYGFRRADVEVFRRFRECILSERGDEVLLATSFRGHSELVGVLNAVFSSVLGEMRQDLEAHREQPPHEAPHVRAYAMESEKRVPKAMLQRAEATHIARLVREMMDQEVSVYDAAADTVRPVRPGDVAVLSRVWAPLELYGEALAAVGIPSVHAGGGNLLETREAKDGLALLRFLADPTDDLALVAILRSPFFAVEDPLLHELAQEHTKTTSWWKLVQEAGGPQLHPAQEILGELLSKRRLEPPTALLQLADHLTGYTAIIANLPGAGRREADWRGFRELVGDLERGAYDAFTVVRWLRQLNEAGAEVPRPPLEVGEVVGLMTIHAAKGLEWPVVIVPDLARAMPSSHGAVVFDPELGVAVDFGEDEGEPALYRLIADKKARLQEDEARRIFYVAPTRARDHLILTSTDGETNRFSGIALLRPGLEVAGVTFSPVAFRPEDALPPVLPSPAPNLPPGLLVEPIG